MTKRRKPAVLARTARETRFVEQSEEVLRREPLDSSEPVGRTALLQLQLAAVVALHGVAARVRQAGSNPERIDLAIPDSSIVARIWVHATERQITCFAIEVSLDGGKTFIDPRTL